ncbi:alkaline shock response membrane anchor protein AmaP [Enterococcus sp. LJL99]
MKIIKSMILLILIVGLFGLVGMYSLLEDLNTVSYFFQYLLNQYEWFYPFLQGTLVVVTVFILLLLLIVVAKPIVKKNWRLEKELGQINFPPQSLAAIAKASIHELVAPENVVVNVQMTKKQLVNVDVIVSTNDYSQLQAKGQAIQNQIAYALPKMAKLETGEIKVVFKQMKTDQSLLTGRKKAARVI